MRWTKKRKEGCADGSLNASAQILIIINGLDDKQLKY